VSNQRNETDQVFPIVVLIQFKRSLNFLGKISRGSHNKVLSILQSVLNYLNSQTPVSNKEAPVQPNL